jgi:hypothetical protein
MSVLTNHPKTAKGIYSIKDKTVEFFGDTYRLIIEGGHTRSANYHLAQIRRNGHPIANGKCTYHNRTWESWEGESATKDAIRKLGKSFEQLEDVLINGTRIEEAAETDRMFNNFKAAHDELSDRGKEIFTNSGISIESKEDAQRVTGLMKMATLSGI